MRNAVVVLQHMVFRRKCSGPTQQQLYGFVKAVQLVYFVCNVHVFTHIRRFVAAGAVLRSEISTWRVVATVLCFGRFLAGSCQVLGMFSALRFMFVPWRPTN